MQIYIKIQNYANLSIITTKHVIGRKTWMAIGYSTTLISIRDYFMSILP